MKLTALALEQSRRLRSGQHSRSWGNNKVKSGHSTKLRLGGTPKDTDAAKPDDPRGGASHSEGRSMSRIKPERERRAAAMNTGLVHIDSSLRRVNRDGILGLQIGSLASWLTVAATRLRRTRGAIAGFGWWLRADAAKTGFPACWKGTESSRGYGLTFHAALCGETRGTTRLRQRGETGFTSGASASGESTGQGPFGGAGKHSAADPTQSLRRRGMVSEIERISGIRTRMDLANARQGFDSGERV